MGAFSNYLELEILDHVLGNAAYTAPATVYIGLVLTATPCIDTTTGTTVAEPSGGSYARVSFTNNATNWPAASGGSKSNGVTVEFAAATGSWGEVSQFFIADAATLGNILVYGDLAVAKTITSGDTAKFTGGTPGNIVVTLD